MIAFVSGPVAALAPTTAVIEVGGIGMAVQCSPHTLADLRIGQEARLATSLVVREDSLTLYGFADDDQRQVFELLQTASGVGPRLAQAMLAVHSPDALRLAVSMRRREGAHRCPRHRQEGCAETPSRAEGQARRARRRPHRLYRGSAPPSPPPGATSCRPP